MVSRILEAAEISSEDIVLEIGPGRGVLTRELASRAGQLIAIELDDYLSAELDQEFQDEAHVSIVHGDARQVDISSLVPPDKPYKLVANLPYYAALPIVRRILELEHNPTLMVVMVQREVAKNMTAQPGEMTLLSVATQLYGKPRNVMTVPPKAFRPMPKVTSALVRIDVYSEPALPLDSTDEFFRVARAGFSSPRKQIHNCLQRGLDLSREQAEAILTQASIDPKRRPQTLSLNEWGSLYQQFRLNYSHDEQSTKSDAEGLRQGQSDS